MLVHTNTKVHQLIKKSTLFSAFFTLLRAILN
nr:MAG TPA: hypothetical protein [Caudoviricetes sp.]